MADATEERKPKEWHIAQARERKAQAWVDALLPALLKVADQDLLRGNPSYWRGMIHAAAAFTPDRWAAFRPQGLNTPGPETVKLIVAKLSDIAMKEVNS